MISNFKQKFIEFCESKDPDEEYNPNDINACALGQFVESQGYIGKSMTYLDKETNVRYPYPLDVLVFALAERTFGELLERLV